MINPATQLCKASFQIKDAFAALRAAKLTLYEASEKAIAAKAVLDKKKSDLLAGNTITGKNAEIRDAQLAQECWLEIAELEAARSREEESRPRSRPGRPGGL